MTSNDRSKKRKTNNINKAELWNIFENEIEGEKPKLPLECIYRACGNREMCERCETILAFSEEGFLTCTNSKCGIIYKDIVDQTAEWRYYGADDNQNSDPTRCGMPINPLLEESSYGCKVLCIGAMSYEMRKIRRYTEWQSMPYKEKSQYDEFQIITTMAQNAGMPKMIIDDAIRYHKKISEYELTFRGDNRDGILAASIYISCRRNECPRTAHELAEIFHLDKTSATNGCSLALDMLNNVERNNGSEDQSALNSTSPKDFIERYCSRLNMTKQQIMLALFIAKKVESSNLIPDNTPNSIAAGIVYFICQLFDLSKSKTEIKGICGVSEVTINKCFKKLEIIKEQIVPSQFMNCVAAVA